MPKNIDIGIFFIARTEIDKDEIEKWLGYLEASDFDPQFDNKTPSEVLIEMAGRRCYKSFVPGLNPNVTKIRTDITDYIDNILKSGHGSVLEHATYSFAIEGVSRVFTGEMNRHRAGFAVSEGSMRYIRLEDMPWWMPPSMQVNDDDSFESAGKKRATQAIMQSAFAESECHYKLLLDVWRDELAPNSKFHAKKQITSMMRRIVPMGIATGGIWTGNIRAIRHVLTMRTTEAAEEEICFVFSNIMKRIKDLEPTLFGDFEQDEHGFFSPKYKKV